MWSSRSAGRTRRRTRGEAVSDAAASQDHRAFLESGAGELFQAVSGSTVLSSVLVLRASTSGYYQSAGTSQDGMAIGASAAVIALTKAVTDPDRSAAKRAFDAMMQMGKIDIAAIEAARRGPRRGRRGGRAASGG